MDKSKALPAVRQTSPLDSSVSIYTFIENKVWQCNYTKKLRDVLTKTPLSFAFNVKTPSGKYNEVRRVCNTASIVEEFRKTGDKNVKRGLLAYTPAGKFRLGQPRTEEHLIESSRQVQIDIDKQKTDRKKLFAKYDWITAIGLSASGKGTVILANTPGDDYEASFWSLVELFENVEGLEVDTAVSSANEIRFVSLPNEMLVREFPAMYEGKAARPEPKINTDKLFQSSGKLTPIPEELRGTLRRVDLISYVGKCNARGVPMEDLLAHVTGDLFHPESCLHNSPENIREVVEDLYTRYAEQHETESGIRPTETGVGFVATGRLAQKLESDKQYFEALVACLVLNFKVNRNAHTGISKVLNLDGKAVEANDVWTYVCSTGLKFSKSQVWDTLTSDLIAEVVDPVQVWYDSLPQWDGATTMETLAKYLTFPTEEERHRFTNTLTKWMVNALDFYFNTGRSARVVPIFVGPQNKGKTECMKWLMFFDCMELAQEIVDFDTHKDNMIPMTYKLFGFIDELSVVGGKHDVAAMKKFISWSMNDIRVPYGKEYKNLRRRCSFLGSMNPNNLFLTDDQNTRYVFIEIQDFDWRRYTKEVDRFQLWAYAKKLLAEKFDYLLTKEEVEKNEAIAENYRPPDMFEDSLLRFFRKGTDGEQLSNGEIIDHYKKMLDRGGIYDGDRFMEKFQTDSRLVSNFWRTVSRLFGPGRSQLNKLTRKTERIRQICRIEQ